VRLRRGEQGVCLLRTFASLTLEICDRLGVGKMIPFGSLQGASGAIELAWLAAKQGRVDRLVLFEALYLSPTAKAYIDNVFIPSLHNLPVYANGSHLLRWWFSADAGPIGPSSQSPVAADLAANQQKTIDDLTIMATGWQFKMAWSGYNELIVPRFQNLARAGVKTLFIDAGYADYIFNTYGLDKNWSETHINEAIPPAQRKIVTIANATQGALQQNATQMASAVCDFLGGWPVHQ